MSRKFLITKKVFLVLSILLILAIPVISLVLTALFWQGICMGFSSPAEACTWQTYTMINAIFISFFVVPLLFLTFSIWLSMAAAQFFTARKKNKLT